LIDSNGFHCCIDYVLGELLLNSNNIAAGRVVESARIANDGLSDHLLPDDDDDHDLDFVATENTNIVRFTPSRLNFAEQ